MLEFFLFFLWVDGTGRGGAFILIVQVDFEEIDGKIEGSWNFMPADNDFMMRGDDGKFLKF